VVLLHIAFAVMHTFPSLIRFAAFTNVEQDGESVINYKIDAGISWSVCGHPPKVHRVELQTKRVYAGRIAMSWCKVKK
jgi:hypothetical protein